MKRLSHCFRWYILIQIAAIVAAVLLIQGSAFIIPQLGWLPDVDDANSFIKTIWQVHASVLGISIIVVTIIITVIANERDRSRTWKLYSGKTGILQIICFNLVLEVDTHGQARGTL